MTKLRGIFALLVFAGLVFLNCSSENEPEPVAPPIMFQGKVSVENRSEIIIYLLDFTQTRGDRRQNINLGIRLSPDHTYFLHNILDQGGQLFPGGDKISIRFVAVAPDPNDPNRPLFDNTVNLTVNGSSIIQVKSGGQYGISPG